MKIRMLTDIAGPDHFEEGQEYEVESRVAKAWLEAEMAEPVAQTRAKVRETAQREPRETR